MINLRSFLQQLSTLGKQVATVGLILLVFTHFGGLSGPVPVQAQDEAGSSNVVFSMFPECEYADTGSTALVGCLRQIVMASFVVAIIIFFIRVTWLAVRSSLAFNAGTGFYKEVRESIYGLAVGMVLTSMPVAIMAFINPLSQSITFNFLEELNMGTEASLTDVTPDSSGCIAFSNCVITCTNTRSGEKRLECVSKCKSNHSECEECHQFIAENGVGAESDEFRACVAPAAESHMGGGSGSGGNSNVDVGCLLENTSGDTVELFKATSGGVVSLTFPSEGVRDIVETGRRAGVSFETIAFVASVAPTEGDINWEVIGLDCYGVAQICAGPNGTYSYEKWTEAVLGRIPETSEFLRDHEMQMRVIEYALQGKLDTGRNYSSLDEQSDIFVMSAGWIGFCSTTVEGMKSCGDGYVTVFDYATAAENNYNLLAGDCSGDSNPDSGGNSEESNNEDEENPNSENQ